MHIVFVTRELAAVNNSSGGLASFTANMARIFAKNKHKVTILVVTSKEENYIFDENIKVESIHVRKKLWDLFDTLAKVLTFNEAEKSADLRKFFLDIYKSTQTEKRIREINSREKIDIIHYCNLDTLALKASKCIPYVIRISSWPNVYREACRPAADINYEDAKLTIRDRLMNYPLKKSRYNISPSNISADIGRKKFGIETTVIESPFVSNRKDWDKRTYYAFIGDKKYILHFGSLSYLKGTHIVAQLAKELLNSYPNLHLVLAGNNEELIDEKGQHLKADLFVRKCAGEFSDRVIYVGRLTREQLYPLIQNAELCLLPYRMDNLSNACIEAMAMGKIVIGTDGASFEQLIENGISGFLCERENPSSFMHAVRTAMEMSDEEKKKMISKAAERIKFLNPDIIYQKYYNYYREVINNWNIK